MTNIAAARPNIRHDWSREEILALYGLPFNDLLFRAQTVHRANFDPNSVQVSTLLSIKTGACPEDCAYCPQSAHHKTGLEVERLMEPSEVVEHARRAQSHGATRFCMGAAWRSPRNKEFGKVLEMVRGVKELGMESCMTLGMLSDEQTRALKEAGLDYYNHNLDTAPEYYGEIIGTRNFQDRLDTLEHVRDAGINVCCGGIVGMGEDRAVRAGLLRALATLPKHPESVPINQLVAVEGTPLADTPELDHLEFVRTIAVARILMPESYVRLSAGREEMPEAIQAWCFFAGANSIFYGDKLLTTPNPDANQDRDLLARLGIQPEAARAEAAACAELDVSAAS